MLSSDFSVLERVSYGPVDSGGIGSATGVEAMMVVACFWS